MEKTLRPNVYMRGSDNYMEKKGEEESSEGKLRKGSDRKDRKIEPSTTTEPRNKETARAAFHLQWSENFPSGKP